MPTLYLVAFAFVFNQAMNSIQEQGGGGSGQWGTLIDDVSGDRAGGLIWARDVPIRADSARLTVELHMGGTLVSGVTE